MLRLSLNASVRNCFAAALALHCTLILLVIFLDHRSVHQVVSVPAIDPNVRVVFSPFAGSAALPSGGKKVSPAPSGPQKEPVKTEQRKKGKTAVQRQKQKAPAPSRAEKKTAQAISRVAPPIHKKQLPKKPEPVKKRSGKEARTEKKKISDSPKQPPAIHEKVLEHKSPEPIPDEIVVGRAQYEEYRVAREIRSAIERTWVAPRGTDSEARCILSVEIDAQGKVKTIETRTASGSALFDSAARYAASQTIYPKEVWGKTLVVEFTP